MKWTLEIEPQVRMGIAANEDGLVIDFLIWRFRGKKRNYSWETTEPRKIAIADSFREFLAWCVRTDNSPKAFKLIEHTDQLDELHGLEVDVYYIGESAATHPINYDTKWNKLNFRREIRCYE